MGYSVFCHATDETLRIRFCSAVAPSFSIWSPLKTMTSLSNEIATCCKTLCAQEAWVFGKKPALKAVEGLFQETTRDSKDAVSVEVLLPLAAPMAEHLLPSGHTDTIKTTCALLVVFVMTLGVAFCPFADQVVVPLLNAGRKMRRRTTEERLANPSLPQSKLVDQMLWQSAETCLDVMSSKSRYNLVPMLNHYDECRSVSIQCLVLKQVGIVLGSWTKPELEPYFDRMRDILHEALYDRNGCIRMAARAAFSSFCSTWSEHKDELLQLPPPEMRDILVQCYGGHGISTALANGPVSADMAKDAMVEEDVVEEMMGDVVGARVDEILDVHLSVVISFLLFLSSTLWSLPLLMRGLLWPVGVSSKTQVAPIHARRGPEHSRVDQLCEDQRYEDQLRPADHSDFSKDSLRMWMAT
ncbi:hypothetical protein AC1031_016143 [Aphanomyces cochlioides]|nr:hypothetical protein AC1031_016143 [Aphanomyces cochlioides]